MENLENKKTYRFKKFLGFLGLLGFLGFLGFVFDNVVFFHFFSFAFVILTIPTNISNIEINNTIFTGKTLK